MRVMILAAGRGERMRPLTDHTPKPLLAVGGKPLIVWHLERLAQAGLRDVVVNHAWLGERIEQALGDGSRWGVDIRYSAEGRALETAGGIAQALPLLGPAPFLVMNGDIWCDWNPAQAEPIRGEMDQAQADAWLLLTDNPPQHPQGDFSLRPDGRAADAGRDRLTFTGIGIYRPELFAGLAAGKPAALAPLLRLSMARGAVRASRHAGRWVDVGTPQRLQALDAELRAGADCGPGA
ncbi:N-acetylmuramate alpha-1-phosphate uridylyltransferase MurU [Bordetella sp. FB-8]|uniref:N-acetylmuramate alpha-1-phosphate uridylyltransferase MurU n=1 Tax=Bordetella sp. FB-8 TaxID=1159870 RepID=UPI00037ACC6B|nr:nucleotidyltransferase family protein [Bordetella sp. FB-8]